MKISYSFHIITRFLRGLASATLLFLAILLSFPYSSYAAATITESVPIPLPAIIYSDKNGLENHLDTSKSKLTVLHFWATWCVPCAQELPELGITQKLYKDKGLQIIAISLDMKKEKVTQFLVEKNISNLAPFFDSNMKIFQTLKIKGLPSTVFINAKGEEIGRAEGVLDWQNKEVKAFVKPFIDKQ